MKGERDDAGPSPQILYVPVLILTKENTASWRKRSDLVVGLLQFSTKISVFSYRVLGTEEECSICVLS